MNTELSSARASRRARKPKTPQHRGRVLAFQVLYEVDLTGHDWQESLAAHAEAAEASPRVVRFAESMVRGVMASHSKIDLLIAVHAPMWPIDQLSPVDRNVLRLALYELLPGSLVPPKAAINEAIELAKEFGSEASSRFINGVLGSALEELATAGITSSRA